MKKTGHLSLLLMISLLFSIFSVFACGKEKTVVTATENNMPAKDTITNQPSDTSIASETGAKYLALGDSYTIGENVQESERFPAQTVQLLRAQNINIKDPEYIATTGWTTSNLLYAINSKKPVKNFDIVTLLIGVNDQYQRGDTAGYRERFSVLLNKAVDFAGGKKTHVFVLSIPDYSVTPFVAENDKASVSQQIDLFNAIKKEVTLQNGIAYIDITPSTRQAGNDALLIAKDGLHPSSKEYAVWAGMLAPMIKNVIADFTD